MEGQRDARPNLGEDRMDRIERILEGMAGRILELQPEQRRVDALERYLRQNPPVFRGRPVDDPAISEYWLDQTEKILHRLRISNEDKVECVTYMLEEEVTQWWRSMQRAIPSQIRSQGSATDIQLGEAPQMSWERFKELFNRKFFPTCWKLARALEFMSLR